MWRYLAFFFFVAEIVIYSAEEEITTMTPNYLLNCWQHITNLYDYIANLVEKNLSFIAAFSCLRWGQLNKDSISLRPDRQLRNYLQPTAMRQNGPWKTEANAEAWENENGLTQREIFWGVVIFCDFKWIILEFSGLHKISKIQHKLLYCTYFQQLI